MSEPGETPYDLLTTYDALLQEGVELSYPGLWDETRDRRVLPEAHYRALMDWRKKVIAFREEVEW